jgi:hypothetical protein
MMHDFVDTRFVRLCSWCLGNWQTINLWHFQKDWATAHVVDHSVQTFKVEFRERFIFVPPLFSGLCSFDFSLQCYLKDKVHRTNPQTDIKFWENMQLPRRPVFEPMSSHVGFVVDKLALGQILSEYFGFPCQFSFRRLIHTHHHLSSGAGTTCQIRSCRHTKWTQSPPKHAALRVLCIQRLSILSGPECT